MVFHWSLKWRSHLSWIQNRWTYFDWMSTCRLVHWKMKLLLIMWHLSETTKWSCDALCEFRSDTCLFHIRSPMHSTLRALIRVYEWMNDVYRSEKKIFGLNVVNVIEVMFKHQHTFCGQERSFLRSFGRSVDRLESRHRVSHWIWICMRIRMRMPSTHIHRFICIHACKAVLTLDFVFSFCFWCEHFSRIDVFVIASNQLMRHGSSSSLNFWMRFG